VVRSAGYPNRYLKEEQRDGKTGDPVYKPSLHQGNTDSASPREYIRTEGVQMRWLNFFSQFL